MTLARWGLPVLLALLLAPFCWSSGWREDELACLADALRVTNGEVLYRDFFAFTSPLSYWLAAGLFSLTGPSLLAARILLAACVGASALLVRRLVRVGGGGEALGALAAIAVVLGLFRPFPAWTHHWIAAPFALGSLLLAMHALGSPRGRGWIGAGALAGLTLITTQTDGIVAIAVLTLGLTASGLLGPLTPREAAAAAGRALAGLALVIAPVLAVLAFQGALADAWTCTWVWPRAHYAAAGGANDLLLGHDFGPLLQPLPGAWPGRLGFWAQIVQVLGLVAGLLAASALAATRGAGLALSRLRTRTPLDLGAARDGWLALAALGYTALACRGRPDYVHLAFYAPFALAFGAAALGRLGPALGAAFGPLAPGLPAVALAGWCLAGGWLVAIEARQHPDQWLSTVPPDTRLRASEAIRYIQAHTQPGDRIVSLPLASIHCFYGRPNAGDMSVLVPPDRRYTTEADYQALARRITERRPALILVTPDHPDPRELPTHLRFPLPGYTPAGTILTPPTTGEPRRTWVFRLTDHGR